MKEKYYILINVQNLEEKERHIEAMKWQLWGQGGEQVERKIGKLCQRYCKAGLWEE